MKKYALKKHLLFNLIVIALSGLVLVSCGKKDDDESEIAKNMTITIGPEATTVLPRGLTNEFGFKTCIESGVAGPYVRYNTFAIKWEGSPKGNKLLPYLLQMRIDDPRLASKYSSVLTATGANSTLARVFGITNVDYIDASTIKTYKNTDAAVACYPDFGGLPAPKDELSGSQILQVPVKFKLSGVVEDGSGNQTPFTKEFSAFVTYFDGSVIDL